MINTQLTSQIANAQKNDIKTDSGISKDKLNSKDNPKEALSQALKQNLGLSKNASDEEVLTRFVQNETSAKLKELVNKLLDQINAQKNPDSPMLKQGKNLNLAPNFANELKVLSTELAKSDTFTQVLDKLNQILKPASEIKNSNLAPLLKNSGIFFEAKLKDALNEELLPKSFHSLISTIKSLSSEKIGAQIAQLANANLSPKDTLKELRNIIYSNKNENKQILNQSSFKALLNLSSKLENFKNYIAKNPSHTQEKILPIASKIAKELNAIKNDFFKALNRPENLMIKDTELLKQSAKAFEKLENTLKNILGDHFPKTPQKESILESLLNHKENIKNENIKEDIKAQNEDINKNDEYTKDESPDSSIKQEESEEKSPQVPKKENSLDDNDADIKQDIKKEENLESQEDFHPKEDQDLDSKTENRKDNTQDSKNITKENPKFYETKTENKTSANTHNPNNNPSNTQQLNNQTTQNIIKNQEFIKQNIVKNLAFSVENLDLEQVQDLSKSLSNLSRKVNESLKELEPHTQNAKLNQAELKNLEHKLNLSTKDLAQIKPKTEQDIAESLHHDVKSTLLQISNLAKNEGNEAVYNQANRLLAQIEINQLMSLANDSINTYLPFSWDDLNDSKIMFRRGKKDKFFAQIKLEFAKLGDLEILISLNNEKYIDINIMAENIEFRKTIYENAHELKRNINKAGLLSANFFVGDIIRSKFDTRNMKNLDLEMGMDKKV
ncbi:flagellar hook-length control protein FliK [Campylobacter coli]|uniref:Flagellar hook-length control protein FliK n=1 Tax=Campylobacter coli TaxID=195 RepID=A0A5T1YMS2_CAMCO|nr:flagellar hook-length control protein FliK [Campylobacter coli]EEA6366457.1 flagellar hook-length control protein FliK [Campylobacter coli]EGF1189494.1 flagellar hook-length control protein FliK [Campylobacter coli]ELW6628063.1 flagellar hook-length control protein FliK [Campylobacter coli]